MRKSREHLIQFYFTFSTAISVSHPTIGSLRTEPRKISKKKKRQQFPPNKIPDAPLPLSPLSQSKNMQAFTTMPGTAPGPFEWKVEGLFFHSITRPTP